MSCDRLSQRASVALVVAACALLVIPASPALASVCTLSDHIKSANTNTAVGFCPAGTSHDVITIAEDITLTEALPPITGTITIEGGGYRISGNNKFRIFDVNGGNLTLRNLSLTNGRAKSGGAIKLREGASVTVEQVVFRGNGAINGGAIASTSASDSATVRRSRFFRNRSAEYGGAIRVFNGAVTVAESSFEENRADYFGGAIQVDFGRQVVNNSTFSGNSAVGGGAVNVDFGSATLSHVTMVDNVATQLEGDAFYSLEAAIYLRNSIIANDGEAADCSQDLAESRSNLSPDGSCGDLADQDLRLSELTGAPAYLPLLDGSPAIDAADPRFCLETDQIGTARPQGGGCDVGAIESVGVNPAPTPEPDLCTLRDQIIAANTDKAYKACPAGNGADTIHMVRDYTITEPLSEITSGLTIEGNGYTVSGDERRPIFVVRGAWLKINNLTMTEGRNPRSGGGAIKMLDNASVVVNDSRFINNQAKSGGAIAVLGQNGKLTIIRSRFEQNVAQEQGGAIDMRSGTTIIHNSSFVDNSGVFGGAIEVGPGDELRVTNSTFSGNRASSWGGALAIAINDVTLTHLTMINNMARNRNPYGAGHALWIHKNYRGVKLRNSIIASGASEETCFGPLQQNFGNLIDDGSCSSRSSGDPMLGDESGAPVYFVPGDGSPAIDAADPRYCLETDQLGTPRPQGRACDIGAIESPDGSAARVESPAAGEVRANCSVTTTHVLNFRNGPSPAGARIGLVRQGATLDAIGRIAGWFNVEYQGVSGWISAEYVVTQGDCG